MNLVEIKKHIENGGLDKTFDSMYKDTSASRERYIKAIDSFNNFFADSNDVRLFSAPGRTEVGGNHTDHQHGRVLAGSIDLDAIAVVAKNNENKIVLKSEGYDVITVDIADLCKKDSEEGTTLALIRGCCNYVKEQGFTLGGFNAYVTSNVLRGSGLSSSAAFEVLICNILNGLFCERKLNKVQIAVFSQKAEREYFGKPCGLLDQMASSQGGFTAVDFFDPSNPVIENVDFDITSKNYVLCVVDTHGDHADLTQDYADITIECKKISNYFGKEFLREVNTADFYASISDLREKFGDRAVLRAIHFFNEDQRANEEKIALQRDDFERFLDLVNESGDSSYKYLQNIYSVSNVSNQGLSLALALTEMFLKGEGACRVHGGGFAGTIQCYIPADKINEYKEMIDSVFGENSCQILKIRSVGGCEIKI